jgi:hypothetical protein
MLKIQIAAAQHERNVRIFVSGNAIGIAPEHQKKICKVFQRLHSGEKYPGIGLAIVKRAISRMGGQSDPGVDCGPHFSTSMRTNQRAPIIQNLALFREFHWPIAVLCGLAAAAACRFSSSNRTLVRNRQSIGRVPGEHGTMNRGGGNPSEIG